MIYSSIVSVVKKINFFIVNKIYIFTSYNNKQIKNGIKVTFTYSNAFIIISIYVLTFIAKP